MDRFGSERPAIPRLPLPLGSETPSHFDFEPLQLTTCRSESEDFILPSSFRTSRASGVKIPVQLEKLTGMLDVMMESLRETQGDKGDEDWKEREWMEMKLEDAVASEWRHREEKLELYRELQDLKAGAGTEIPPERERSNGLFGTIVVAEMRQLKRHIENLTGQKVLTVQGSRWEQELPLFVRSVIEAVATLVTHTAGKDRTGDIGKAVLKVSCSAEDLQSVVAKVSEILEDLETEGGVKEFGIQLGAVGVTVRVDGDEVLTDLPPEIVNVLAEQIACDDPTSSQDLSQSSPIRPHSDTSLYIRQLEDKVTELQGIITTQRLTSPEIPAETLTTELESKLEEVMYKLTLANKQIEHFKQCKYVCEAGEAQGKYKLKLAEALLREEKVKEECKLVGLEREKLRLRCGRLEEEKQNLLQELSDLYPHPDSTSDAAIQTSLCVSPPCSSPLHSSQCVQVSSPLAFHLSHLYQEVEKGTEAHFILKELREIRELVENKREIEHSIDFSPQLNQENNEILLTQVKNKENELKTLQETLNVTDVRLNQALSELATLKEERLFSMKTVSNMEELKHTFASFVTAKSADSEILANQRNIFEAEKREFEIEREKFREKRNLLREKVEIVNERQRKIQGKEKLLSEKETLLQLEEKKTAFHKAAVDQLWQDNEAKRRELLKCHKVIDDEWKVLMEETRQFEALKVREREGEREWEERERELERQAGEIERLAAQVNREKETVARSKAQLQNERLQLESDFSSLLKSKQSLFDRIKRCEVAHSEVTLDRLTLARQKAEIETNRRDLAQMIPAIQRLLG